MLCSYCKHEEKDHCVGNIKHALWSDQKRQVPNPRTLVCAGRHCTQPICCCTKFIPMLEF